MPDLNMLDLLNASRPLQATIGLRAGKPVQRSAFLNAVYAWQDLLERTPGQKFALYFSDSIEFAAALLGAWHAGKTIYLAADTLPATCAALHRLVDGYLGEFPPDWQPHATPAAAAINPAPGRLAPLDPDFPGLVVFTSGSTGAAQAIPKKLAQLATEVATLESLFGDRLQGADIVATVSHQHIYGLLFKVLWPLAAGRAIHALSIAYPEELAGVLGLRDCVLVSSPAHLKRLPDTQIWGKPAAHLKAIFSSGGPLTLDVASSAAKLLGQMPIEIYGSSETGGIAWRQRHAQLDESWTAMPGVAWRISHEDGVLEVRSAHLPDQNWFALSDRVLGVDADHFQLQGRVDRIVKIEEKRISLDTIERQLAASPLVQEARVLVRDGKKGQRQRIAAFVVLTADGRSRLADLGKLAFNRLLRDVLAGFVEAVALPRSWRYLDALPVNAQGKTTHAELTALLEDHGVEMDRPRLPRRRVVEKDAHRVVFELNVPNDLLYFDGHFPRIPILAGVVQVDWAIAFAREYFEVPPVFRSIHALKFQRVIRPEMPVKLELQFDQKKSSLMFVYSSEIGPHSGGRIQFGIQDE